MIYEVAPSRIDIGSSKAHSPATSSAGSESTPLVRSWSSSMLMALLGAAATIAFLAAPARAGLMTSTEWNYDFNHLSLTQGAAGSTTSQASDFETQSSTSSSIAPGGNEGWAFQWSSTGLTKGTLYQFSPTQVGMSNAWYRVTNENYFRGRIGFASQGTAPIGNLKSITTMQTTTDVLRFYWNGLAGTQVTSPSGQGIQWQVRLQEDATDRIWFGPAIASASTTGSSTTWQYFTPATGAVSTSIPFVPLSSTQIEFFLDPVTSRGSFNLNGAAVYTDIDLVGATGVNLRNLNNFSLFTSGGTNVNFGVAPVVPVPEPSSLLAVAGAGFFGLLFARRRRRA